MPSIFQRVRDLAASPAGADSMRLGDRVKELIEDGVLKPTEERLPGMAPVVGKVRRCGGCANAQRGLNGGGLLPGEGEPPAVI